MAPFLMHCPGAEIGRQAWLRAMCPLGRAGSSPALGTSSTRVAKLVDAQSSEGCAFGRAGSNPVPGTCKHGKMLDPARGWKNGGFRLEPSTENFEHLTARVIMISPLKPHSLCILHPW